MPVEVKPPADEDPLAPLGGPARTTPGRPDPVDIPVVDSVGRRLVNWNSAPEMFDSMVNGIRRDRAAYEQQKKLWKEKMEADWQQVLSSMRELQRKVKDHPRILYFTISRDGLEIVIKITDYSRRGFSHYTMARRHPYGQYDMLDVVWLIDLGGRELFYREPKEAMAELVARLAPLLA